MYLIDTHAHIYLREFDADREIILSNAKNAGVKKILMPAIDSETHQTMLRVEAEYPECISMMGLHPCSVKINYEEELKIVKSYLEEKNFIAIGEIGIDLFWDKTFMEQQIKVFHLQIELALEYDLPIVIHSRNAIDECIEIVQQHSGLTGVFHCFSGSYEQAMKIIEMGFMLGIGGVLTFKNAGLDKVISQTGLENVILETDAPYLAPIPHRGKRNESSYLKIVAEKLSSISNIKLEEISQITTANANKLFRLA